ncbi:hypothetical protein B0T25DRAFT_552999 [Lasiosphaeria hispida]|uniref:Uncharacterized protein n=1 Tax=Lasiosphaeria hispida TaxID=260671 RepID=A0AAJ0HC28_9PEZI|nr:hypothetical protein B0T25DRAFT_552999 [Lasiosphaeria hispida]
MPPSKKRAQVQAASSAPEPTKLESSMTSAPNNSITVASVAVATSSASDVSDAPASPASTVALAEPGVKVQVPVANEAPDSPESPPAVIMKPETELAVIPPARNMYENSNLEEITLRQLEEDINAYSHDLAFCRAQLEEPDLTPQESRTLQLRQLDLGHQIRHSQHRIETLRFQTRNLKPARAPYGSAAPLAYRTPNLNAASTTNGHGSTDGKALVKQLSAPSTLSSGSKRAAAPSGDDDNNATSKRSKVLSSPEPQEGNSTLLNGEDADNMALQRLGYWKCRLCEAPKYLLAGTGRSPAAPCKWPLKDISKMITHFTEMHTEHMPAERCVELGTALSKNRGPFEYWLRRTRAQNVGDGSVIDECINSLIGGKMPGLLRRLSRAAAGMPTS